MEFVEKVRLFNTIAGNTGEFNARQVALYTGLILEEVAEMIESYGDINMELLELSETLQGYSTDFKYGAFDKEAEFVDRISYLDAGVDIAVVGLGGCVSVGSDVIGACHEVADSNLSKFPLVDGQHVVLKDDHGKIQKPETYRRPELSNFLK